MIKFLANENFPYPSIKLLRAKGFEAISIGEDFSGISDKQVLEMAVEKKLVILTFDRDYGELIFKYMKETPPAVVYFRTKGNNPIAAGQTLIDLLQRKDFELIDYFTVIEETGIRQRKLK
jgi:predicted nuclease of predicted toxin-antitoxin system